MIHNLACVNPDAKIADNVTVGPFTTIDSNVEIGEGCKIGSNVTILSGARIGRNVTIFPGAVVTVVGANTLLMAYTHVAHDCVIGNNVIVSNATQFAGEVVVDDFAVIGGGSLIHQFCHIGSHVMLQGGALVNKDIPPFIRAAREPISYAGINIVGLKRRRFSNETINEIEEIYRLLYNSGMNVTEAVAHIESEVTPNEVRDAILNFVKNSERGIVRGY